MSPSHGGKENDWSFEALEKRLQMNCLRIFRKELPLGECYTLLSQVHQIEKANISRCPAFSIEEGQVVAHNAQFLGDCNAVENLLLQYVIPLLQILCLIGNLFNLFIYRLPYFRGSSAVNFLRVKAIANLLFVELRVFEVIHVWTYSDLEANPVFEWVYWHFRPFIIFLANINGTIATWMTLFITVETMVCVLWPHNFRDLCTRKSTFVLLISSAVASTALHLLFLQTHTVVSSFGLYLRQDHTSGLLEWTHVNFLPNNRNSNGFCWLLGVSYEMQSIDGLLERLYYWLQLLISIALPTGIMLGCTMLVVTRFSLKKELGRAFSQRRQCVIRLTVVTTLSYLLLEGPALATYVVVALRGASANSHTRAVCALNHTINLLSVLNATIPFFVFFTCSKTFREMSTSICSPSSNATLPSTARLSAEGVTQSQKNLSATENDRLFFDHESRTQDFGSTVIFQNAI